MHVTNYVPVYVVFYYINICFINKYLALIQWNSQLQKLLDYKQAKYHGFILYSYLYVNDNNELETLFTYYIYSLNIFFSIFSMLTNCHPKQNKHRISVDSFIFQRKYYHYIRYPITVTVPLSLCHKAMKIVYDCRLILELMFLRCQLEQITLSHFASPSHKSKDLLKLLLPCK